MKRWVIDRKEKVAFSVIPKVGSTSIKTSVPNQVWRRNDEVRDWCDRRIAFIRHPLRRIESMYRFLKDQHEQGASTLKHIPTDDYKTFVDYVLRNTDRHWESQVEALQDAQGKWVPTETHRFEDLPKVWKQVYGVDLPRRNQSPDYPVNYQYRRDDLLELFAVDMDAWENL